MTSTRISLSVRGERADRIESIKDDLADAQGFEPDYADVLDELIRQYDGQ